MEIFLPLTVTSVVAGGLWAMPIPASRRNPVESAVSVRFI
jgi:hypothetical protein